MLLRQSRPTVLDKYQGTAYSSRVAVNVKLASSVVCLGWLVGEVDLGADFAFASVLSQLGSQSYRIFGIS